MLLRAWGAAMSWRTASLRMTIGRYTTEAESINGLRPSSSTSPNCVTSARLWDMYKEGMISAPSSGLSLTNRRNKMAYSEKVVDHYENPAMSVPLAQG